MTQFFGKRKLVRKRAYDAAVAFVSRTTRITTGHDPGKPAVIGTIG